MCYESDLIFRRTRVYDLDSMKADLSNETYESISFLDEMVEQSSIVEEVWQASSELGSESSHEAAASTTIVVLQELSPTSAMSNGQQESIQYYNEPKDYDLGGSRVENIESQCFAAPEKVLQQSDDVECDSGQYTCDHCNKVCINRHSLKKHLKSHTDPQFACQVCGKRYKKSENLNAHLRSHGQPTLTCKTCNASFKYHASYHYHIKHVQ